MQSCGRKARDRGTAWVRVAAGQGQRRVTAGRRVRLAPRARLAFLPWGHAAWRATDSAQTAPAARAAARAAVAPAGESKRAGGYDGLGWQEPGSGSGAGSGGRGAGGVREDGDAYRLMYVWSSSAPSAPCRLDRSSERREKPEMSMNTSAPSYCSTCAEKPPRLGDGQRAPAEPGRAHAGAGRRQQSGWAEDVPMEPAAAPRSGWAGAAAGAAALEAGPPAASARRPCALRVCVKIFLEHPALLNSSRTPGTPALYHPHTHPLTYSEPHSHPHPHCAPLSSRLPSFSFPPLDGSSWTTRSLDLNPLALDPSLAV
eukprot:scaffold3763_cov103-Isochrysis_galbana.AAC.1